MSEIMGIFLDSHIFALPPTKAELNYAETRKLHVEGYFHNFFCDYLKRNTYAFFHMMSSPIQKLRE